MGEPKVIKRYANRKLYDTERSCYVTLDEIAEMVKEGEDVRVIDNKTKDDLTAVTLAQIIVEEEKKVSRMPLKLLRGIIQSSNEAIGDLAPAESLSELAERLVDTGMPWNTAEPALAIPWAIDSWSMSTRYWYLAANERASPAVWEKPINTRPTAAPMISPFLPPPSSA